MYEHGSHLGHATSIMLMNFHFLVPASLHSKLAENDPVVTEKIKFTYVNDLWPNARSRNYLTFNTHIFPLTPLVSGHRLCIVF